MPDSLIRRSAAPTRLERYHVYLWVKAIREAYLTLLPVTIVGAICVALNQTLLSLPDGWLLRLEAARWTDAFQLATTATLGVTGLLGAICIAMRLSALLPSALRGDVSVTNITTGAVAGTAFLMTVLSAHSPKFSSLGYGSIFQGIVVAVASAELMAFYDSKIRLRSELSDLEGGIALHRSLNLTACGFATLATVGAGAWLVSEVTSALAPMVMGYFSDMSIREHLSAVWLNPLIVIINQALWLIGVNGGQFLLHLSTLNSALFTDPNTLYHDHAASAMFVNAFAHLGGAGSTLGLIAYCLVKIKDEQMRRLAWFSLLPAILNVNELLLFGIPLVFGRTLAVPFVLAPLLNSIVATLCVYTGVLHMVGDRVAWSTPIFFSGYLMSHSLLGALLQLLLLGLSAFVYGPYLERMQTQRSAANRREFGNSIRNIMTPSAELQTRFSHASGVVGDTARLLMRDFSRDLRAGRVAVFYQPQHDAAGRIVGAEALLRWTHPSHGQVPTQAIINLAEESDLILHLGRFVLRQVCQDIVRWREQGLGAIAISINISPLQLEDPNWTNDIEATMRRYGVQAHELVIELTEGQGVSNTEQADQSIFAIEKLGLQLSMDDFGMGCTSLLYLHRFGIHEIKFDGVLSRGIEHNRVAQDIVRCVSDLAHSQNAKVVAEFVETKEQLHMLQQLGCDYFQGWLFSPAIDAEAFVQYVTRHRQQ